MDCNGTDRENLRNKLGVLAAFLELDYRVVFDLYGVAFPLRPSSRPLCVRAGLRETVPQGSVGDARATHTWN